MDKYRDPIHGFIDVTENENKIINSRPFQRLRNVKQLAMTYYVYHGAEHTRFGHSLGVMHLVSKAFLSAISEDGSMKAKTSHTLNPVPFIVYDNFTASEYKVKLGREDFGLSAVAATTVNMLGYEAPDMWDESMIEI